MKHDFLRRQILRGGAALGVMGVVGGMPGCSPAVTVDAKGAPCFEFYDR